MIPFALGANTLSLTAQNIGGGQKQIDVTKTYTGLSIGSDYVFSYDVLFINKSIQISDGTTTVVVNSVGNYSISFTATSPSQAINFFHQSSGQPAKIELDNVLLEKTEVTTLVACVNVSDNEYRYGFNGMEKDDEAKGKGNSYTSLFRNYDARLARWLSIDPKMTAEISPYAAMSNSPMFYTDPEGDTVVVQHEGKDYTYTPGMTVDESYPEFVQETFNSMNNTIANDQSSDGRAATYMNDLHSDTDKLLIVEETRKKKGSVFSYGTDKEFPKGYDLGVIRWNRNEGFQDVKLNKKGEPINSRGKKARKLKNRIGVGPVFSPDRALFHELGHAREKNFESANFQKNRINKSTNALNLKSQWTNWEEHRNIHDMNEIFGETRTMHLGKPVPVNETTP